MSVTTASTAVRRVRAGLGWSLAGNAVLRLGNVALTVLVARVVAPEEYGAFAVALTVWAILSTLAELGLGADLVRATDPERRAPTTATLGALAGMGLAAGMAAAAAPIATAFASPGSEGVIRVMALAIAVFGLGIVPAARLQRDFRQRALVACNLLGLAAGAALTWALATHGAGAAALAWGQVANQSVVVLALHLAVARGPRFGWSAPLARESIAFCVPLTAANLLSWVLLSVDNLVVARTSGPGGLGLYVLAFNVSSWPMSVVGTAVRVVALPGFAQVEDDAERNRALARAMVPTAVVAAFLALSLATTAGPLVRLLYGERWAAAAAPLVGLAVFGGIRVVLDLLATFLVSVGATAEVLRVQVAWLLVMVPAMVVGVRSFGLRGAGWTHVAVAVAVVVPLYLVGLRRAGVDVRLLVRPWAVAAAAAAPAAVVTAVVVGRLRDAPPVVAVAAGGLTAVATFVLPLHRWCRRSVGAPAAPVTATPIPGGNP